MSRKKQSGYITILVILLVLLGIYISNHFKNLPTPIITAPTAGMVRVGEKTKVNYSIKEYTGKVDILFVEHSNGVSGNEYVIDRDVKYLPDTPYYWDPDSLLEGMQGKIVISTGRKDGKSALINVTAGFQVDFSVSGMEISADDSIVGIDQEFDVYFGVQHNSNEELKSTAVLQIKDGNKDPRIVSTFPPDPVPPDLEVFWSYEKIKVSKPGRYVLSANLGNRDFNRTNNICSLSFSVVDPDQKPVGLLMSTKKIELSPAIYRNRQVREYCGPRGRYVPAEYKVETEHYLVDKGPPEVYGTRTKKVLVREAYHEETNNPAHYKMVTKKELVEDAVYREEIAVISLDNKGNESILLKLSYNTEKGLRAEKEMIVNAGRNEKLEFPKIAADFLIKVSKQSNPDRYIYIDKIKDVWTANYQYKLGKVSRVD